MVKSVHDGMSHDFFSHGQRSAGRMLPASGDVRDYEVCNEPSYGVVRQFIALAAGRATRQEGGATGGHMVSGYSIQGGSRDLEGE